MRAVALNAPCFFSSISVRRVATWRTRSHFSTALTMFGMATLTKRASGIAHVYLAQSLGCGDRGEVRDQNRKFQVAAEISQTIFRQ